LRSEEAHPDSTQQASPGPHIDFNKRVQEKLRALGFYTGPVNGDIGPYTQAALAQFQLSVPISASGQLDDLRGTCDTLFGPEKERCLQQGGT
jgi:peptidoglycan hydrolase-like protein with peptidoglycan-binding domain